MAALVAGCSGNATGSAAGAPLPVTTLPRTHAAGASPLERPAPITFTLHGDTYTLGEHHPFPPCGEPLRWLAYVRPDDFHDAYCSRCSSQLCGQGVESTAAATRYPPAAPSWSGLWIFVDTVAHPAGAFWCNERRYVRHLIGAELGLPVPPGRFARHFAPMRWYAPQSYRRPTDLPAAARANLAWLDAMIARCDGEADLPTGDEQRLVDGWFEAALDGEPPLPARLYVNCDPRDERQFREILSSEAFWRYSARTPVVTRGQLPCADAPTPGARLISVHVGAWLTGEMCSECEGHQSLVFEMVGNELVALHAFMAG